MAKPLSPLARETPARGHEEREKLTRLLLNEVVAKNPDPPRAPQLAFTSEVTVNILHMLRCVGGFGLQEPGEAGLARLKKKKLRLRAFHNPDIASRARRPTLAALYGGGEIPDGAKRPIFINTAHYPNQSRLADLRHEYAQGTAAYLDPRASAATLLAGAADEITSHNGEALSPAERISLYLYREVDGNFTVKQNNNMMLREEIVHTLQSMLQVPYGLMRGHLLARDDTPDFLKRTLASCVTAQRSQRDNGAETARERAQRRLNYLWNDREMQARIDKIFCEAGVFPKTAEEGIELLRGLGIAFGGIKDLVERPIWERSRMNWYPSRSLAELNYTIVAGFPDGASDYFMKTVLPYHIAQVARINSFDEDYKIVGQYGFEYHALDQDGDKTNTIHALKPLASPSPL